MDNVDGIEGEEELMNRGVKEYKRKIKSEMMNDMVMKRSGKKTKKKEGK